MKPNTPRTRSVANLFISFPRRASRLGTQARFGDCVHSLSMLALVDWGHSAEGFFGALH